jgi:hypothetical protein
VKPPPPPDRLGIPETMSGTTPGKTNLGDLIILIAFLVVLLACAVVTWAAVEGLIL